MHTICTNKPLPDQYFFSIYSTKISKTLASHQVHWNLKENIYYEVIKNNVSSLVDCDSTNQLYGYR